MAVFREQIEKTLSKVLQPVTEIAANPNDQCWYVVEGSEYSLIARRDIGFLNPYVYRKLAITTNTGPKIGLYVEKQFMKAHKEGRLVVIPENSWKYNSNIGFNELENCVPDNASVAVINKYLFQYHCRYQRLQQHSSDNELVLFTQEVTPPINPVLSPLGFSVSYVSLLAYNSSNTELPNLGIYTSNNDFNQGRYTLLPHANLGHLEGFIPISPDITTLQLFARAYINHNLIQIETGEYNPLAMLVKSLNKGIT